MARVFITGSSSGLGLMVGQRLVSQCHRVVLHGRDPGRARVALDHAPGAQSVVVGDLSSLTQMRRVADQVNRLGRFDAIIHNAGVGYREPHRIQTEDGLPQVFAVNVLAPYVLTALIDRPDRLIYLSSAIHASVAPDFDDLLWRARAWDGRRAYAESKLYDAMLAFAVARLWPGTRSNAVEPGWVATRMGGPDATDELRLAHLTQAWLAVSHDALACTTGEYFYHQTIRTPNPAVRDECAQETLLNHLALLSDAELPPCR